MTEGKGEIEDGGEKEGEGGRRQRKERRREEREGGRRGIGSQRKER
jgi:hypothetical protein